MFTLEQIKSFHSHVKSGADFPLYVQNLISIWLSHYDMYVSDGHAEYVGKDGFSLQSEATYEPLNIASVVDKEQFIMHLKSHQRWETNYMSFIRDSADSGVYKWTVNTEKMTCTYYNKKWDEILEEVIPS